MKITELHIGDRVRDKHTAFPMIVVGIFTTEYQSKLALYISTSRATMAMCGRAMLKNWNLANKERTGK